MPTTDYLGRTIAALTDAADIDVALRALSRTTAGPISASSRTDADSKLSQRKAAGTTGPVFIYRTDTGHLELHTTGDTATGAWRIVGGPAYETEVLADSAWQAPAEWGGGYSATNSTIKTRRVGSVVWHKGLLRPDTGTIPVGTSAPLCRVPLAHRPAAGARVVPAVGFVNGGSPDHVPVAVAVDTWGNLRVITAQELTGVIVDGVTYRVD